VRSIACSATLYVALLIVGCSSATDDPISQVKDAVLQLDKSIRIGQAFDGYKFFRRTTWSSGQTENGRTIVNVVGPLDLAKITSKDVIAAIAAGDGAPITEGGDNPEMEKAIVKARQSIGGGELEAQFQINQDNSVEVHAMAYRLIGATGEKSPDMNLTEEQISMTLQEIYEERLVTVVAATLMSAQ
jgi:hypothetical protein